MRIVPFPNLTMMVVVALLKEHEILHECECVHIVRNVCCVILHLLSTHNEEAGSQHIGLHLDIQVHRDCKRRIHN